MATKIYTKTGDSGETGLLGGARVLKSAVRVEAYGHVDELNAVLGQVQTTNPPLPIQHLINKIQHYLFELGAELATQDIEKFQTATLTEAIIKNLEQEIDKAEAQLTPLKQFILPGGTTTAAFLHTARTICRRAERSVVALRLEEPQTRILTVHFLNRLSDLLFVQARLANHLARVPDIVWEKLSQT